MIRPVLAIFIVMGLHGCQPASREASSEPQGRGDTFGSDVTFLEKHTDIIVLAEPSGNGKVAIAPALQGRVMTSTSNGESGMSYGWINKELFSSGDTLEHINAFGGEERLWLGPEGGQFSIFFQQGKEFTFDNWQTPRLIDLEPFDVVSHTESEASFSKSAQLENYSGTRFDIRIDRSVRVLNGDDVFRELGMERIEDVRFVAYETTNALKNTGAAAWSRQTGLLSIWMLGMFKPSPGTTIVLPFNKGDEKTMGPLVIDDYFGKVPSDRLKVGDGVIYFKGDGEYRSKIGLTPRRARNVIGSYDGASRTLTLLKFNKPDGDAHYVNSKWEIQAEPFSGDIINSYNDGAPAPGAKPMGPFYELESSSPAVELKSGESVVHRQVTFHFQADETDLDQIARQVLGVSIMDIEEAFN